MRGVEAATGARLATGIQDDAHGVPDRVLRVAVLERNERTEGRS